MRILLTIALLAWAVPAVACSGNHDASTSPITKTATSTPDAGAPDTPVPAPATGG